LAMLAWRSQEQAIWVAATVTVRDIGKPRECWREWTLPRVLRNLFDTYPVLKRYFPPSSFSDEKYTDKYRLSVWLLTLGQEGRQVKPQVRIQDAHTLFRHSRSNSTMQMH
jgi:hypothetical protein